MQQGNARDDAPRSCVEFVFRVYDNGRRERSATVFDVTPDGDLVPGPVRPTGRVGDFVVSAVAEWRRLQIDPRCDLGSGWRLRR